MVTVTDALSTVEFEKYFVILPSMQMWDVNEFTAFFRGQACPDGFSYNSGENSQWLTVKDIREQIRQHVDPAFTAGM
jgi:hypothetical protein